MTEVEREPATLAAPPGDRLLRDRRWQQYTVASYLTRFPQPMGLLSLQLVGMQLSGHISDGALLVGLSSICGVSGPLIGRWYDGGLVKLKVQLTAIVAAVSLAGIALCAELHAPFVALLPLVMVQGMCLGGTWAGFRSLMSAVVPTRRRTQAHYVESLMVEVGYALGPLLVTAVAWSSGVEAALWAMVASELAGVAVLHRLYVPAAAAEAADGTEPRILRARKGLGRHVWLMCVMACVSSFGFSLVESNVPSRMAGLGFSASSAGLFMALLAGGSCLGGLAVSRSTGARGPVLRRAAILFGVFGVVSLPAAFASSALAFGIALPINSLPLVPLNGLNASEIERTVGTEGRGAAFGMLNAATRLGGGGGAALNGVLLRVMPAGRIPLVASVDFFVMAIVIVLMAGREPRRVDT